MREIIYSDSGQGLTEYALILSLVIIGLIFFVTQFGDSLVTLYQDQINGKLP
ncbi:Flp family type IVb pilin [Clostridiaceae bacterium HFYG-1003]|nr:Flp family type IVb pilin [Clostridiaceae bacterium HFYG-1003]